MCPRTNLHQILRASFSAQFLDNRWVGLFMTVLWSVYLMLRTLFPYVICCALFCIISNMFTLYTCVLDDWEQLGLWRCISKPDLLPQAMPLNHSITGKQETAAFPTGHCQSAVWAPDPTAAFSLPLQFLTLFEPSIKAGVSRQGSTCCSPSYLGGWVGGLLKPTSSGPACTT